VELPFQVIETVNEPREKDLFSAQAAQQALAKGWRNKLIWGDNKLVCASLLEEFEGKVDLIYIDPPFDTGDDFSFRVSIGDQEVEKQPSIFETKAYYDTWGRGAESYLQMLYERLVLISELLAPHGTVYVHVDESVEPYVRLILDEIMGADAFVNSVVWKRTTAHNDPKRFGRIHDRISVYCKSSTRTFNRVRGTYSEEQLARYRNTDEHGAFRAENLTAPHYSSTRTVEWRGVHPGRDRQWRFGLAELEQLYDDGRILLQADGRPRKDGYKVYLDEAGGPVLQDLWVDLTMGPTAGERMFFPTQKPEALLERIIQTSSNEGDLVADFFCGSGTTIAVAEKLGRRWIGADLGRFAVHTSRKRLLDIPGCKPFEVLNLGKYERQYWQGVTTGRNDDAYVQLMLQLYRAQPLDGATIVHGVRAGIAVHVGPIDSVVTIDEALAAVEGARELGYKRLHVLGWDWQMGIKETVIDQALALGVQLSLKRIPSEIMDPRAREKGDVEFFEMNYVDAAAELKGRSVQVFLEDFIIADLELVKPEIQDKIEKFSDYIDYWAVDFDYRSDTFHNQWQSFRTRKRPKLELESAVHAYDGTGDREILVKVIDIFGNDTTKLLRVSVP